MDSIPSYTDRPFGAPADTSWTTERIQKLTEQWAAGRSCNQIAVDLGGISRSAVMGKVHRLHLPGRVQQVRSGRVPRKRELSWTGFPKRRSPTRRRPTPVVTAPIECVPLNIKLADLHSHQCRYIPGDVKGSDTLYCGLQTLTGQPWCAFHYRATHDVVQVRQVPGLVPAEGEAA